MLSNFFKDKHLSFRRIKIIKYHNNLLFHIIDYLLIG